MSEASVWRNQGEFRGGERRTTFISGVTFGPRPVVYSRRGRPGDLRGRHRPRHRRPVGARSPSAARAADRERRRRLRGRHHRRAVPLAGRVGAVRDRPRPAEPAAGHGRDRALGGATPGSASSRAPPPTRPVPQLRPLRRPAAAARRSVGDAGRPAGHHASAPAARPATRSTRSATPSGLWHEQSREDRDPFVHDRLGQHRAGDGSTTSTSTSPTATTSGAYDYGSIMHYPRDGVLQQRPGRSSAPPTRTRRSVSAPGCPPATSPACTRCTRRTARTSTRSAPAAAGTP